MVSYGATIQPQETTGKAFYVNEVYSIYSSERMRSADHCHAEASTASLLKLSLTRDPEFGLRRRLQMDSTKTVFCTSFDARHKLQDADFSASSASRIHSVDSLEGQREPLRTSKDMLHGDIGIRDHLHHFTWAWFTTTMSTGGIALILAQTPHRFNILTILGDMVSSST